MSVGEGQVIPLELPEGSEVMDVEGARGAGLHPILIDPYDDHAGADFDRIRSAVGRVTGLDEEAIKIESPKKPELGDLAFPCFPLAKALKKAHAAGDPVALERLAEMATDVPEVQPLIDSLRQSERGIVR